MDGGFFSDEDEPGGFFAADDELTQLHASSSTARTASAPLHQYSDDEFDYEAEAAMQAQHELISQPCAHATHV